MLVEFRVENYRSLRDEQVLTMEAGHLGDSADVRPRAVKGNTEKLLPLAAIYGANGSGKSNVLMALGFMRQAIVLSHRNWTPEGGIPHRDPFAWGTWRTKPSLFEATLLIESVRYQYGFVASDDSFLEEWLYAWPRGKKQVLFERDNGKFKFGENLKGENKLIEEVTRPNALFLSAAVQHRHVRLQPIYSWFQLLHRFWQAPLFLPFPDPAISHRVADRSITVLETSQYIPDQFRAMLRNADIGIEDYRVVKNNSNDEIGINSRIEFKHRSSLSDAWLPLEQESNGTQTLLGIAVPILETLRDGSVLLVDELESSLHPSLAQEIVLMFNDPKRNPRNAQLIFTTHDTNLLGTTLGEPAVRRDQVWLTEKDPEGATVLYPLTDYKPRKAENIERGYLQGRYGAIPFLGNFALVNGSKE